MKKIFLILPIIFSFFWTVAQNQFECGVSTVTDTDGYIYNTILVGSRCWFKENMRTTHYSNGQSVGIPKAESDCHESINLLGKLQINEYLTSAKTLNINICNIEGKSVYHSNLQGEVGNNIIEITVGPMDLYLVSLGSNSTFRVIGSNQSNISVNISHSLSAPRLKSIQVNTSPRYYYDYDNDPANDEKFGKLYTPCAALNVDYDWTVILNKFIQGICPNGWHVSNDTDWMQLELFAGMTPAEVYYGPSYKFVGTIANKLKTSDTTYWTTNYGTDDFGFSARGAGGYWPAYGDQFTELKNRSTWLSYRSIEGPMIMQITNDQVGILKGNAYLQDAHSVRCVKDY